MKLIRIHIREDRFAIKFHGPFEARGGWTRRREQRFNETARVLRVKANDLAPGDDLFGGFARVRDDKGRHRAAFGANSNLLRKIRLSARVTRATNRSAFCSFILTGMEIMYAAEAHIARGKARRKG